MNELYVFFDFDVYLIKLLPADIFIIKLSIKLKQR